MASISNWTAPKGRYVNRTPAMWERYNGIAEVIYDADRSIDFVALLASAKEMGFPKIRVHLQPEWPLGARFRDGFVAAGGNPTLIEWAGLPGSPHAVVATPKPAPAPKAEKAKAAEPVGTGVLRSFAELAGFAARLATA